MFDEFFKLAFDLVDKIMNLIDVAGTFNQKIQVLTCPVMQEIKVICYQRLVGGLLRDQPLNTQFVFRGNVFKVIDNITEW